MGDVAKHVGHGVVPGPPNIQDGAGVIKPLDPPTWPIEVGKLVSGPTVFDGDDAAFFNPSFDIEGAAARALAAHDRNDDGALELDGLSNETTRFTATGTASIRALAEHADQVGNRDGSVTVEEIANVIRRFDQGDEGDGRLSGQERETFLAVFGEERRTFGHFGPPWFRHPEPIHLDKVALHAREAADSLRASAG
jgi:hypothetical protein